MDQDAGEEGLVEYPPPGRLGEHVRVCAVGSQLVGAREVAADGAPLDVGQLGAFAGRGRFAGGRRVIGSRVARCSR